MITDREKITEKELAMLTKFCNSLGGAQNSSWNLSQALEKMDLAREISLKEQNPAIIRSVFKFEICAQQIIETGMKITRDVVELQNCERRILMNQMRTENEAVMIEKWNFIIENLTQEGCPWHYSKNYPK